MILVDTSVVVPVSVTGSFCPMNCKHCGGFYLKHMIPVQEMESYAKKGFRIFLISGGMYPDGSIPFEPFEDILRKVKDRYGVKYNFHIGFPRTFPKIVDEIADAISADFFASEDVMEEIYGLRRSPEKILELLLNFSKPVVPHITVGILCGRLSHEFEALEILSNHFKSVVLNVFVPTPKTAYSSCSPPEIDDVVAVFKKARNMFRTVFLGCMQPRGGYRVNLQKAIVEHVDGITKPVMGDANARNCCAFEVINRNPSISSRTRRGSDNLSSWRV